jgi:hypothetical protein
MPSGMDTVSDVGVKVIELNTREFLTCGNTWGFMINYNAAYAVKTTSTGNVIWKKQYDFSIGGFDSFTDLVQLPDSNYLLTGTTTNTVTNDYDVFLTKLDTAGNIIWFKQYAHVDYDQSTELKLTPDGKVIIVGKTASSGTYNDVLLIKTDLNGNLIWRKRFGNTYDEIYNSIEVVKNNTEYLLGGRYGYSSSGTDYYDMSIMRTDTAGNIIWQQQYGTVSGNEYGGIAINTLDSGVAICGIYNDSAAILKVNKTGVVQWIKNYGISTNSFVRQVNQLKDSCYAMIVSDYYATNSSLTGYLIKADKNGNILWKRVYPAAPNLGNFFFGFNTTADKGFIMTGQYNHIGQPYQNTWLVKTDSLGCDSVTCSYLPTALNDLKKSNTGNFTVYPNPFKDELNINYSILNFEGTAQLQLIELATGSLIDNIELTQAFGLKQFNTENMANGLYVLSLKQNNQPSVNFKVVNIK